MTVTHCDIELCAELVQSRTFPRSLKVPEANWKGQRGSWTSASAHALHLPLIAWPGISESLQEVQKVLERDSRGMEIMIRVWLKFSKG